MVYGCITAVVHCTITCRHLLTYKILRQEVQKIPNAKYNKFKVTSRLF